MMTSKKRAALIRVFIGISLLLIIFYSSRFFELPQCQEVQAKVNELGVFGPIIFIVLYSLATLLFIPGTILTLMAGLAFGWLYGSLLVIIAANLGAGLAFLTSRFLLKDLVEQKLGHKDWFIKLKSSLNESGLNFVIFIRLVPIFPFNGLNYACGLLPLSFKHYLIGSFIGMIPGTLAYVYLGETGCKVIDAIIQNKFTLSDFPEDVRTSLLTAIIMLISLSVLPIILKKIRATK